MTALLLTAAILSASSDTPGQRVLERLKLPDLALWMVQEEVPGQPYFQHYLRASVRFPGGKAYFSERTDEDSACGYGSSFAGAARKPNGEWVIGVLIDDTSDQNYSFFLLSEQELRLAARTSVRGSDAGAKRRHSRA